MTIPVAAALRQSYQGGDMASASGQSDAPFLTLTEVLAWKHDARHEDVGHGHSYIFDGIFIWSDGDGRLRTLRRVDVPQDGWRHRADCACPHCAPYGSAYLDGNEDLNVSSTSGQTQRRLAFAARAAAIQLELGQLIVKVSVLFSRILSTGVWPSGDGQSRLWAERGIELVDEWMHLEPPQSLAPAWEELGAHLDVLAGLLQAVPELADQAPGRLGAPVARLRAAFSQQLSIANEREGKLREEEVAANSSPGPAW